MLLHLPMQLGAWSAVKRSVKGLADLTCRSWPLGLIDWARSRAPPTMEMAAVTATSGRFYPLFVLTCPHECSVRFELSLDWKLGCDLMLPRCGRVCFGTIGSQLRQAMMVNALGAKRRRGMISSEARDSLVGACAMALTTTRP